MRTAARSRRLVKVGIIGFTPPTIMSWDKRWLDGKVYTTGVREAALKYIPEMRRKGADIVVAIAHGGLDASPYTPQMENAGWYLAQVPGVDAMLLGHAHQLFPNAASTAPQFNLPGVDKARGLVHGVPTVMANLWGKHLGVIALQLRADGKRWTVEKDKTVVEARSAQNADKSFVAADPAVLALIRAEHEATIAYVKTPVGSTDFRMTTLFCRRRRPVRAGGGERGADALREATMWRRTCRSTRSCRCCRCRRRSRAAWPAPSISPTSRPGTWR